MVHVERTEVEKWAQAVARALRATRAEAQLSQAEVERKTGITRSSYRLYESGDRSPTAIQLAAIAQAFGVSFSTLMGEIERRAK